MNRGTLCTAFLVLVSVSVAAQNAPAKNSRETFSARTLVVDCNSGKDLHRVLSPVSLSEKGDWRAYVEVDVHKPDCLHTTRLWSARANNPFRLLYLMPPMREAVGNGMQILGWARSSRMLLVRTEEWQEGSDAEDEQHVLAVDAETGMVYEPALQAMLQNKNGRQCSFRVTNAGFGADQNVRILVRAEFHTSMDADETLEEVPLAKRCVPEVETWSFNFASGEIEQVPNTEPLQLFSEVLPRLGQ